MVYGLKLFGKKIIAVEVAMNSEIGINVSFEKHFYLFITLNPFPPEKLRPIALLVFQRVMGDHIQNWPEHASKFCRVTQLMRLS